MICYKVVTEEDGEYYSSFVSNPKVRVKYPLHKGVKAMFGKIFTYRSKYEAFERLAYVKRRADYKIFLVEAKGVNVANKILPFQYMNDYRNIREFWQGKYSYELQQAPNGVLMCDKIKLIKEVKYNL